MFKEKVEMKNHGQIDGQMQHHLLLLLLLPHHVLHVLKDIIFIKEFVLKKVNKIVLVI
jgi:hypothetical protein